VEVRIRRGKLSTSPRRHVLGGNSPDRRPNALCYFGTVFLRQGSPSTRLEGRAPREPFPTTRTGLDQAGSYDPGVGALEPACGCVPHRPSTGSHSGTLPLQVSSTPCSVQVIEDTCVSLRVRVYHPPSSLLPSLYDRGSRFQLNVHVHAVGSTYHFPSFSRNSSVLESVDFLSMALQSRRYGYTYLWIVGNTGSPEGPRGRPR
jgi:hypothetical protein